MNKITESAIDAMENLKSLNAAQVLTRRILGFSEVVRDTNGETKRPNAI